MTQTTTTPDVSRFSFVTELIGADLAEHGAFCQFINTETGEPLYLPGPLLEDGTPDPSLAVGAYVRSINSNAYEAHTERLTRQALERNKKAKTEAQKVDLAIRNQKRTSPELFAGLVARFQNTSIAAPGEWTPTYEQKLTIALDPYNGPNVERCLQFASEPSNYPSQPGNAAAV